MHLFVHYTISLSSLCKLIWRHGTYKMPVRYMLSSVWVRLSIFSQLSIVHYMGLCVFRLPISLMMTEKVYTLSYYHHQIRSMNCYPLFRVRSWNNGMRCMSLYILMNSWYGQIASWDIRVLVAFLKCMIDNKLTLIQVMARSNLATSNYMLWNKAITGEWWYVTSKYTNEDTTVYQLTTVKPLI